LSPRREEIFSLLQEVDANCYHVNMPPVDRAILLCNILFPMFQKRLKNRYLDRERVSHLGEIHQEATHIVSDVFKLFLQLPRKIKTEVISILTSQYRLTPFDTKKLKFFKIPSDPTFF
jgi:hypothetical protein